MAITKLEKATWHSYFDAISRALVGKQAEIEVGSLTLGEQVAAEWLPLLGITYEPRGDMLEIVLEGLDHMIRKPVELYIDREAAALSSLEVIDADGVRQIIRLREPLMLPAPQ